LNAGALDREFDICVGTPDFILVKATSALDADTILAIFVEKKSDDTLVDAASQLHFHMQSAAPMRRDPTMKGFLIDGDQVQAWQLSSAAPNAALELVSPHLSTTG